MVARAGRADLLVAVDEHRDRAVVAEVHAPSGSRACAGSPRCRAGRPRCRGRRRGRRRSGTAAAPACRADTRCPCARCSRIFLVPVPVNVARTILPIFSGVSDRRARVGFRRLDQLDLAAERLQPLRDHVGDPVEPLALAAAGLDRASAPSAFRAARAFPSARATSTGSLAAPNASTAAPAAIVNAHAATHAARFQRMVMSISLIGPDACLRGRCAANDTPVTAGWLSAGADARPPAQLAEQPDEVGELVVGVQPAGIGQHPQRGAREQPRLAPERGPRQAEGGAVGADAQHGDDTRPVAPDLRLEPPAAREQLVARSARRRRRSCGRRDW